MARGRHEHHHITAGATLLLVLLLAVCCLVAASAPSAFAARGGGSVMSLIKDASDGVINGTYSISTVRAALSLVRTDPSYMQYSDIDGVLVDYLASLTHTAKPTPTPTVKPTATATGGVSISTPSASANPNGKHTESPKPGTHPGSPGASPAGNATASPSGGVPLPGETTGSQAGKRLAAAPWFFAIGATVVVLAVIVVAWRRRVRGSRG